MTKICLKTRRTNAFPGDNWIGLDWQRPDGTTETLFGMWPRTKGGDRFYESDTHARTFKTITEAKSFAKELVDERVRNALSSTSVK